jgi:plastocyanin
MKLAALLTAGLLLVLTACTPGEPEFTANQQVAAEDRIEEAPEGGAPAAAVPEGPEVAFAAGNEIAWDNAPTEAPAGPVTISLSCDTLPHTVVIEEANGTEPIVACEEPGTVTGGVELPPGTYEYYCDIPGHESGMTGEMTVA